MWDLSTLETALVLKGVHEVPVTSVSWHRPTGSLLCVGSADCTASLWNARDGSYLTSLEGHTGWVLDVCFSCSSQILATASWDSTIKLWDSAKQKQISTLAQHSKVGLVLFLDRILVINIRSPSPPPPPPLLLFLHISPSTQPSHLPPKFFCFFLFRFSSSFVLFFVTTTTTPQGVWAVDFKPISNSNLLCSGSEDGTVYMWDARSKRFARRFEGGHSSSVYSVRWSPDGALLATGSEDTKVCPLLASIKYY